MKVKAALCVSLVLGILLILLTGSTVSAARCQISNVSYAYPQQASPNQQIEVTTNITGSCASTGEDYYEVRVDLIDTLANATLSYSNTPIGYTATAFNVTTHNLARTPSHNITWPLEIHVYVIRAGGTSGSTLFHYQTTKNAAIQIVAVAVPEFTLDKGLTIIITLIAASLILRQVRVREKQIRIS